MKTLLRVEGLTKTYGGEGRFRSHAMVHALQPASFELARGQTLGIVGESGSGKTTLARCLLRAIEPSAGSVWADFGDGPLDITSLSGRDLKPTRRHMQMVFQDPFASLNPRQTVASILEEPLLIHGMASRPERRRRAAAMLERVGLDAGSLSRYPHAFSGGQRQRIGIARALILEPQLLVCDESVSALDVSVQAQVINLLEDLREEMQLTCIFVAHDLAVIRHLCDQVLVMYQGKIVERGATESVFQNPQEAYTQLLLSAIPSPDPDEPLQVLKRTTSHN